MFNSVSFEDINGLDDFGRGNITGEQSGRSNLAILGDDDIIDVFFSFG
jgi:hypothetical protein